MKKFTKIAVVISFISMNLLMNAKADCTAPVGGYSTCTVKNCTTVWRGSDKTGWTLVQSCR
jgi:hypothetical protein